MYLLNMQEIKGIYTSEKDKYIAINVESKIIKVFKLLNNADLIFISNIEFSLHYIETISWCSENKIVVIYKCNKYRILKVFEIKQNNILQIKSFVLNAHILMLASSVEQGEIEILCSLKLQQGVRFCIYFPEREKFIFLSPAYTNVSLAFWDSKNALIAINTHIYNSEQIQGKIFSYSHEKFVELEKNHDLSCFNIGNKKGNLVSFSTVYKDGFSPGVFNILTKQITIYKNVNFDINYTRLTGGADKIICGGYKNNSWKYKLIDLCGNIISETNEYTGALLGPGLSKDENYLLARYEATDILPSLSKYNLTSNVITPLVSPLKNNKSKIKVKNNSYTCESGIIIPSVEYGEESTKVIFYLHGGPNLCHTQTYSPLITELVNNGYRIIAPNFPGSTGFGLEYKNLLFGDWAGIDLKSIIELGLSFTKKGIKPILYGVSYGGYLALMVAAKSPHMWGGVIACSSFTNLEVLYKYSDLKLNEFLNNQLGKNKQELFNRSPFHYMENLGDIPMMLIHGARDRICPIEDIRDFVKASKLHERKHLISFIELSDVGHEPYAEKYWVEHVTNFLTNII